MDWNEIIPALIALGGAIIGGLITILGQKWTVDKEIKREKEKEKETRLNETLRVYSEFLEAKLEHQTIFHVISSKMEFQAEVYQNFIRPIFYRNFPILHQDVSKIILNIDRHLEICGYNEEITSDDNQYFVNQYNELESLIMRHINKYRGRYFNS